MRAVGVVVMGLALVGVVLSVVLVVGGYLKLDDSLRSLSVIAILGLFVVWIPTLRLKRRLAEEGPTGAATRSLYSGCPMWMKRAGYTLMALGALIFFASIIPQHGAPGVSTSPAFIPAAAIGGFGLMSYSAIFNQLYSVMRLALTHGPVGSR